jgi:hypothetical protein
MPEQANAPEVIYLQVGDGDDWSAVTWCRDRINDSDLEYRLVK